MAQLNKENSLQKEAFEMYFYMGDKRSLRAVAEKIDRTERTVAGWSRSFSWVDRVKQREIADAGELGKAELNKQTADVKTRYRILMNNLMAKASTSIAEGKLVIKNVQDLERVVKLDLLLMGEATDKVDSSSGVTELSKADKDRLDSITKLLGGK